MQIQEPMNKEHPIVNSRGTTVPHRAESDIVLFNKPVMNPNTIDPIMYDDELDLFGKRENETDSIPKIAPVAEKPRIKPFGDRSDLPVAEQPINNPVNAPVRKRLMPSGYQQDVSDGAKSLYGASRNEQPTLMHEFSQKMFVYDPSSFLCQSEDPEFELSDTNTAINTYLCMYTVNNTSPIAPILLYGMVKMDTVYDFPSFSFDQSSSESGDGSNNNTFISDCKAEIYKTLYLVPDETTTPQNIHKAVQYKGFMTFDASAKESTNEQCNTSISGTDSVYVFFEIAPTQANRFSGDNMIWTTIHELMNTQMIQSVPVAEHVVRMFSSEPELMYIKDTNSVPVDIPAVLYCATEQSSSSSDKSDDVLLRLTKHKYGYYYLFTDKYTEQKKRYVVFVNNCLYLVGTDAENDELYQYTNQELQFSTIYTLDSNQSVWGVRSVDAYMLL